MEQFNRFVFSMNNKCQHLPADVRQRRVKKILDDVAVLPDGNPSNIFAPPEVDWDADAEWETEMEEVACENAMSREERIKELQAFYGVQGDDEEENEAEQERDFSIKNRYGRNDLHDAVAMGDLALIERLIADGADPQSRNNNGHTAVFLAFLEENDEVISLFRRLGIVP